MPAVPLAGVPARVAVPLPLSVKVTPVGSAPVSLRAAVGVAEVVTLKELVTVSAKVVPGVEVMVGGPSTVRVKDWVAGLSTPLLAVMVKG